MASVLGDLWLPLLPIQHPLTIEGFPRRIGGLPMVVLAEGGTHAGCGVRGRPRPHPYVGACGQPRGLSSQSCCRP